MTLDTDIADIKVRDATLDDVIGIVYVQATTWIDGYPSIENGISEADIRSIDFKAKIINWQHLIRSPNYRVWVAAKADKVVGFMAVLKDSQQAEVYEHCVLPDFQRGGLGTKLWQAAGDWLEGLTVKLRIISYNQAGVAFWRQHGFEVSTLGEVDFISLPTGKNIPTIEMRKGDAPVSDEATAAPKYREATPSAESVTAAPPQSSEPAGPQLVGRAELARASQVRASTIKYYTEIGILPFQQAETRLARRYDREVALQRLAEIQNLRNQGLSIKDIANRLQ